MSSYSACVNGATPHSVYSLAKTIKVWETVNVTVLSIWLTNAAIMTLIIMMWLMGWLWVVCKNRPWLWPVHVEMFILLDALVRMCLIWLLQICVSVLDSVFGFNVKNSTTGRRWEAILHMRSFPPTSPSNKYTRLWCHFRRHSDKASLNPLKQTIHQSKTRTREFIRVSVPNSGPRVFHTVLIIESIITLNYSLVSVLWSAL